MKIRYDSISGYVVPELRTVRVSQYMLILSGAMSSRVYRDSGRYPTSASINPCITKMFVDYEQTPNGK